MEVAFANNGNRCTTQNLEKWFVFQIGQNS